MPWKQIDNWDIWYAMDTVNSAPNDESALAREDAEAARRRHAREAEKITEARVELDAGLYVDSADVDAWIDSIGTDHELPLPTIRRR